jgi:hypothetical protein
MLDTFDEFEFEFEMVICTDLLLQDHKHSSTVREIRVYLTRTLKFKEFKIDRTLKKQLKQSMVFVPSEFELAKFHCIYIYI